MNYYLRYPGDYSRDTGLLSLAEHGAYGVLLDHYYSTEAPLPAAMEQLCRLARAMSEIEQCAVASVADKFFPLATDGFRHNKRADKEILSLNIRREIAATNGKKGGRPRGPDTDSETNWDISGKAKNNPKDTESETKTGTQTESGQKALHSPFLGVTDIQNSEKDTLAPGIGNRKKTNRVTSNAQDSRGTWFDEFKALYPKRAGGDYNWPGTLKAAAARQREDHTTQEFIDGARRYAAYIRATGAEGSQYVKQASTFLGPSKHFLTDWTPPAGKADRRLNSNLTAAEEFMRRTEPTDETI